ncbi:unnamed protein product [Vicia faba]|uniref:Uncharacterized protein n=1 Tax=Vicia faba TaxID=3906 RepID=A0AAV1A1H1_VICFA|nr:unnamed protein product [Vicia faba]
MWKEKGGLWVRRLTEFNDALLGKWYWRVLEARGSLWIRQGDELIDNGWLIDNIERSVGNKVDSLFKRDPGLEGGVLMNRFQRLYKLSEYKGASVAEIFSLGWGPDEEAWRWRRRLCAWEEELVGECIRLMDSFVLQDEKNQEKKLQILQGF